MRAFAVLWAGQVVSQLGSAMTSFALAVWMFGRTGHVGDLAAIATAAWLPHVLVGPWGGVLADRHDRRRLLIAADFGAALASVALLICARLDRLEPWLATLIVALGAASNALQGPAFESATVALVPPHRLGRASGLVELGRGTAQLAAPALAGALFATIGLGGIVAIDLATFALGVGALLLVSIPPHAAADGARSMRGWIADAAEALRFVAARPALATMLLLFAATNFTFAVVELHLKPLVLSFAAPWALGLVLSTVGVGMVVGSIVLAVWGGPRRKVRAILAFQVVEGGSLVLGGSHPSLLPLLVAAFAYGLVIPLTFGCARTVWQLEVPPALQGRVTALRNAVLMLAIPIGYAVGTPLSGAVRAVFDVGLARGSALVVVAMGFLTWTAAAAAFAHGPYRRLDASGYPHSIAPR